MNKTEKSIFARFDERKQGVKSETLADEYTELEQQENSAEAINMLTDADMPNIDSLNEESDYSMFMSDKVSEVLRRKALRKMFLSPSINVLDGLNDYDENYTTFELLGDIIPHDLKQQIERKAKEEAEEAMEKEQLEEGLTPETNEAEVTDNNLTQGSDANDKH